VYITALNGFVHPKVGKLGDYVSSHFPMESFLDTVYAIILQKDVDLQRKAEDVRYLMLTLQEEMWRKATLEMEEY